MICACSLFSDEFCVLWASCLSVRLVSREVPLQPCACEGPDGSNPSGLHLVVVWLALAACSFQEKGVLFRWVVLSVTGLVSLLITNICLSNMSVCMQLSSWGTTSPHWVCVDVACVPRAQSKDVLENALLTPVSLARG